jgi:putative ABC transport system ATP-binding protein
LTILKATHLTKRFKRGDKSFEAVSNVSLDVKKGEVVSIIGRSGCGKTTLLNLLAGLINPDSGQVELDQMAIHSMPDDELTTIRNRKIGFVPQGKSLLGSLSVLDNVRLPLFLAKNGQDSRQRALDLLRALGIGELADSQPASLSGGELRRAALARALIASPLLVIADEPTSEMDGGSAESFLNLVKLFNDQGMTFIMATHDMKAAEISGRVLKMDLGVLE